MYSRVLPDAPDFPEFRGDCVINAPISSCCSAIDNYDRRTTWDTTILEYSKLWEDKESGIFINFQHIKPQLGGMFFVICKKILFVRINFFKRFCNFTEKKV